MGFMPAFGIAMLEKDMLILDAFDRASIATAEAKKDIRNRICVYNPEMQFQSEHEYRVLSDYMKAFKNDEITFFLQPQCRISTKKIVGAESLARWIKEDGLEQRLIVTYSVKYQEYQKNIRNNQIKRAMKLIEGNPEKIGKPKQNDPKRFIKTTNITEDGEVAEKSNYSIDQSVIDEEAKYDGLYAVCTNLDDSVEDIVKVNHRRWEIEECFRIMKTDFKSRPVYHSKDEMIKAHFVTCFLALILYRYLEKKLDEKYTVCEIIETLRDMNLKLENTDSYIPNYIRTDLTDDLHEKFGFRTDFEVINIKNLKKIFNKTKK